MRTQRKSFEVSFSNGQLNLTLLNAAQMLVLLHHELQDRGQAGELQQQLENEVQIPNGLLAKASEAGTHAADRQLMHHSVRKEQEGLLQHQ